MATRDGRISLPLAIGVDCGHPRPLGVGHGHSQWPDLFFLVGSLEANMAIEGGRISPPGRWGGSRPPPVARSISFFFVGKVAGGGRWVATSVAGGGLFIWLLNLLI
jgi:hypothetical protein